MSTKAARSGRKVNREAGGVRAAPELKESRPRPRLSPADAAFFFLERPEIPLAIASLCIFDGPIPFKEFVARLACKLPMLRHYTQIAVAQPMNLGLPTWEDDPHFDIHQHVIRVTLDPPGGEAELEAAAGRIMSQIMDRSRPLWDLYVIDGLEGGRGALIFRVHHALADGISGVRLMQAILDPTPEGSLTLHPPPRRKKFRRTQRTLSDSIGDAVNGLLGNWIATEAGLLGLGQALVSQKMQDGLRGLVGLLPELAMPVERLPFNKPCGSQRKFCWADFDFGEVQAIHRAVGATVNDVVLTVVTRALARYVKMHGQTIDNRFVRMVCPVSLRSGDEQGELGNQISFLPVALPMDIRDPVRMLQAVALRTETMKHAGAAGFVGLIAGCIAAAPPPLQALFWWALPQVIFPFPLLNMICTNVPGSPVPLYAVGRRMLVSYPQVPTGYDLGVGCAVQSYAGRMCFGLIADANVAGDVNKLRDYLYTSFEELRRAAHVKKTRRAAPAPQPKAKPTRAVEPIRTKVSEPVPAASNKTERSPGTTDVPPPNTESPISTDSEPPPAILHKDAA